MTWRPTAIVAGETRGSDRDLGCGESAIVHRITGWGATADRWFGTCQALDIRHVPLGGIGQSLEDAQRSMGELVGGKARRILAAVGK